MWLDSEGLSVTYCTLQGCSNQIIPGRVSRTKRSKGVVVSSPRLKRSPHRIE